MNDPWDDWFDSSIWRIEQWVDFETHPLTSSAPSCSGVSMRRFPIAN
jgi:hypothetical protein